MKYLVFTQSRSLIRALQSEATIEETVLECTHERRVRWAVEFHGPDAALVDLTDSTSDGFALMESLRGSNPRLPILVLSPSSNLRKIEAIFQWGANAYLAAPCSTDRILKRLREMRDGKDIPDSKRRTPVHA
jgi:DNA-binding NarL/FixJ family response regulator